MKILSQACAVLLGATAVAVAQPTISANGMVNAASAIQAGLPNGDVAQGSILSIYGNNMGPTGPGISATSFPLPSTGGLDGVTVQVMDSEGVSRDTILLFVSAGQINAVLPSATAPGQVRLTVAYNGQTSPPQTFTVVKSSVGLFTRNAAGSGPGIVQLFHPGAPSGAPTFNDISNSAIPGEVAVLWGTGLGPVTGDETQQPAAPVSLAAGAEVWVGDQQVPPANVTFQGRSTFAGEDQINFVVPNIPGCYVPVFVKVGNIVSNTVSMSIGASGGTCSDPFSGYTGLNLQANGLRGGIVMLLQTTAKSPLPPFANTTADTATGAFSSYDWTQLAASRGGPGVSVYGACTVFAAPVTGAGAIGSDPITPTYLDAGALSLLGPGGVTPIPIPGTSKGEYYTSLTSTLGMSPGNYTLTATGGADVGPFTSTLTVPPSFVWTDMDSITSVTRANGVTVNWTGGAGYVTIEGYSAILAFQTTGPGAIFMCLAPASAGTFTVPPNVLLALPPSAITPAFPLGSLTVYDVPVTVPFNPNPPSGLDRGGFGAVFQYTITLGYN